MASNTPWILRVSDPVWRDDHDYKKGHRITGSNDAIYIARQDSGPNTAAGPKDPVTETTGNYWLSLADSLKSGGANELTGATTAKKLDTTIVISGMEFDGSGDISNYAVCATPSSEAVKAVALTNFKLVPGASARIRFTYGNTHTSPTLDISGTGVRELRYNNAKLKDYFIDKDGTYDIVYDGAYYQIVNGGTTLKAPEAVKLEKVRSIQGMSFDGSSDIYNYTVCTDAADSAEKNVTLQGFKLDKGSVVKVNFTNGSTSTTPTLNVNKTGAVAVKWNGGDVKEYLIAAGGVYEFVYDGTNYQLTGGTIATSPSAKKLEDTRTINGIDFDGSSNISNFGTCDTAEENNTKVVEIPGFNLVKGACIRVLFTNGNSTTTPTLNVNGSGDLPLKYSNGNLESDAIIKNGIYDVIYTGTYFQIVNGGITLKAPSAKKLANARSINGVQFDGTGDAINYGVCNSTPNDPAKTVNVANFMLVKGASARIRFTYGNECATPTLNINSTGAKWLKYNNGSVEHCVISEQSTYEVVYDGVYYQLIGRLDDSTRIGGVIPVGGIISFCGSFGGEDNRYPIPVNDTVPDLNWCLCDGEETNGLVVPDLRGRFICGSDEESSGGTGGSDIITPSGSVSVSTGNFAMSANYVGAHQHKVASGSGSNGGSWYGSSSAGCLFPTNVNASNWFNFPCYTEWTGSSWGHNHSAWGSFSGNAFDNRPTFYNLCFIMRIA